ncbi:hypothetical protein [Brevibacillus dissolubilis]|uniref:hypothetical protein n=1 Tax=Brevibacillus dissolubilis TaxID=1844116 RepID=UPI001116C8C1|nr:hypothetical protein [Brevibacillus dissolubilis]
MDIQQHAQLEEQLGTFSNTALSITFTQWDAESEDEEEVSEFRATLKEFRITDNEFEEKDLLLVFDQDGDDVEILMEIPAEEVDLATLDGSQLRIFGTEAEVVLSK